MKLGDKIPLINFLDLDEDDHDRLKDLSVDLIERNISMLVEGMKCHENDEYKRISLALAVAQNAQVLACKIASESTAPESPKTMVFSSIIKL